jgi:hypothetical protein
MYGSSDHCVVLTRNVHTYNTVYRFTYHKLFFFIIRRGIGARISSIFILDLIAEVLYAYEYVLCPKEFLINMKELS